RKNTGRPQGGESFEKFRSNYLDITNRPFLPFGYGLSYTKFEYGEIKLNRTEITDNEPIIATINIKNIGNWDGNEVVQLYIRDEVGSVVRPLKELKNFQKVYDLTERVLPDNIDTKEPTIQEYAKYLIETGINSHGIISEKEIAYLRNSKIKKQ
ncbi:MAG TPA: fibronectin type III-like domain-contianing protein, partial [Chitinophagaceae bacterium]|nr:fibronectin type III-like domain-contianing protein [Chitinophagaceae bacterium]